MQANDHVQAGRSAREERGFWTKVILYGGGALSLAANLYGPGKDLWARYVNPDIGDGPIAIALQQQRLTEKNLDCLRDASQVKVQLQPTIEARLLACKTGDVQVVLYPVDKPAHQTWIASTEAQTSSAASLDWLIGRAVAQAGGTAPAVTYPQSTIQNVCQAWQDASRKSKLVRVFNDGGKCYKEIVNVFTGRVEYREEAKCDAKCLG